MGNEKGGEMKQLLKRLIAKAERLGLPREHLDLVREFLDGHEFGLCLDTLIELVADEGIAVDEEFYQEVKEGVMKMGLAEEKAARVRELIRQGGEGS